MIDWGWLRWSRTIGKKVINFTWRNQSMKQESLLKANSSPAYIDSCIASWKALLRRHGIQNLRIFLCFHTWSTLTQSRIRLCNIKDQTPKAQVKTIPELLTGKDPQNRTRNHHFHSTPRHVFSLLFVLACKRYPNHKPNQPSPALHPLEPFPSLASSRQETLLETLDSRILHIHRMPPLNLPNPHPPRTRRRSPHRDRKTRTQALPLLLPLHPSRSLLPQPQRRSCAPATNEQREIQP